MRIARCSDNQRFESDGFKALLIANDPEAWEELFVHFRSRCIPFIGDVLGGAARFQADAEELYGDVCTKIWKLVFGGKSHYRGVGKPKTYLFKIALNTALNQRKKNARGPKIAINEEGQGGDSSDPSEDIPDPQANPEEQYEAQEIQEIILNVLPPIYRETYRLRFFVGLKNCEIALILKISQTLVRVRIARARKLVERHLKPVYWEIKEWDWRGIFVTGGLNDSCVVKEVMGSVARTMPSIRPDDIIKEVGDKPIRNVNDFANRTNQTETSKDVLLIVIRVKEGNKEMEITVPAANIGKGGASKQKVNLL